MQGLRDAIKNGTLDEFVSRFYEDQKEGDICPV
jgi:queuine/archaeosine tRNA-ribosyltransferase